MATNLRYMFYKKRVNNKWKGEYSEKVQGSVSNLLYNDYSVPNVRRANPIRHWRRQGSSSGKKSKLNLISEINKPGNVITSTVNRCPMKSPVELDYRLSKNTGCCSYEQKKAVQLTRHYVKGINENIKYGNNNLNSDCYCDNSDRYYHHTGSYLERKKQRIFKKELEDDGGVSNLAQNVDCCHTMSADEKYYAIHGYNRSLSINDKCKC
jgi:hypothetical protein|tara:strand:- start:664 stop:1290 length:627 start_codon:yes stop_codon:yes gene_type:complete